jgi:creatinine deaminase
VTSPDYRSWLAVAVEEARAGLAEGGIPIGAALVGANGEVLGRGHNRRVQDDDPSVHGETDAFRNEARTFHGGHDWLAENGVEVVVLDDPECRDMLATYIAANPAVWNEDIGEE